MAADPLSDLLKTVRLTGAVFFEIVAEDPWAVGSPAREQILPKILPGADHLIAYHVVTSGRCFATAVGGQAIPLEAGQVVMFHALLAAHHARAAPTCRLIRPCRMCSKSPPPAKSLSA